MYAIFFALAGIIIFVAIAFRKVPKTVNPWRFGAVAIIALIHDILIIVAVFAVLGYFVDIELDLQFITALLATLGFSVNDTIVILDRVRENINIQRASETFEDVIEKSIQQTLRRSINTSVSTLLPLIGLLIFGSEAIFYFILALTVGIVAGTYSSIFIAAPALAAWKNFADKGEM
jgi:preprotein translocase subunit SecF